MSQQATATPGTPPEVTAIEPERVLVLNADEQRLLLEGLDILGSRTKDTPQGRLHARIAYGDEYYNPSDELTRVTLRKRRLETEVKRCNKRIESVEPLVVDDWLQRRIRGERHEGTGASLTLVRKVWAKVSRQGERPTPDEKAAAAAGLRAAGLGDFVKEDFNANSVSAYFREKIAEWDAQQRELPEELRQPLPASAFLPAELNGLIELDDEPHVQVRKT